MALLGHVSSQMSLRYAHLFDSTVRTEYERALNLAKSHTGPMPTGRTQLPITDITDGGWKDAPAINRAWPAATACGHPRKALAHTQTSASTARASTPTPPTSEYSLHSAWTLTISPKMRKSADGSTRRSGTAPSSPDSTRSSRNRRPHERERPGQGRTDLRRTRHHGTADHLHRRRRTGPDRPGDALPGQATARRRR